MPQYFFTIRSRSQEHRETRAAVLSDDAAALDFACAMVRELRQTGEYDDPGLLMNVADRTRPLILSIPFLPACA
ncbi:MAG: DUF6894 family protein [Xanthobacteraceae bacterium]